jgi:hypothetical protein
MNPNYRDPQAGAPAGPDDMAEESTEGNQLTFSTADYPELDGIQSGAPVDIRCTGRVTNAADGSVTVSIEGKCDVSTEGQADKAMKEMSGNKGYEKDFQGGGSAGASDEF